MYIQHTSAGGLNNECLGALSEFARLRGGACGWGKVLIADVDTLVGLIVAGA